MFHMSWLQELLKNARNIILMNHYAELVFSLFVCFDCCRKYRQFYPGVQVTGNASQWWKYAYKAILEQRVYPFTWQRLASHRYILCFTNVSLYKSIVRFSYNILVTSF